jgi:hypothetical protein
MKPVHWIILAAVAAVGVLMYTSMPKSEFRVEVCKEFQGRVQCRIASADNERDALRTASENACALIAGGVTDTMACQAAEPKSVRWLAKRQ